MRAKPSRKPAPWRFSAPMLLWNTTRAIRFWPHRGGETWSRALGVRIRVRQ